MLPLVLPCKAVVTIHDIIHLLYPEFLPSRLAFYYAQRMIRSSLERSSRVISVSQTTRSDLLRLFEVDGRKIEVVYPNAQFAGFSGTSTRPIRSPFGFTTTICL